jgi:hypothetical protein
MIFATTRTGAGLCGEGLGVGVCGGSPSALAPLEMAAFEDAAMLVRTAAVLAALLAGADGWLGAVGRLSRAPRRALAEPSFAALGRALPADTKRAAASEAVLGGAGLVRRWRRSALICFGALPASTVLASSGAEAVAGDVEAGAATAAGELAPSRPAASLGAGAVPPPGEGAGPARFPRCLPGKPTGSGMPLARAGALAGDDERLRVAPVASFDAGGRKEADPGRRAFVRGHGASVAGGRSDAGPPERSAPGALRPIASRRAAAGTTPEA